MAKRDVAAAIKRRSAQSANVRPAAAGAEDMVEQAYESLFGGTVFRQPQAVKQREMLPLDRLQPFHTANIGFRPYHEADLRALADDIAANGLIEPVRVRPQADGYEILSGHNRVSACRLLGWTEVPAEVEDADDDRAVVIATVTNLQRRQGLLPSERGWAYRALLEVQKRQGRRTDLEEGACAQNEHRSKTRDHVAAFFGVDRNKVQREIRLTHLISPLLDAVDNRRLNLLCGVQISYYDEAAQRLFHERLQTNGWKLSTAVMNRIKKACPPPSVTAGVLGGYWNAAEAETMRNTSKRGPITFDRRKFAPYLEQLENGQELEALFLEFLQQRIRMQS